MKVREIIWLDTFVEKLWRKTMNECRKSLFRFSHRELEISPHNAMPVRARKQAAVNDSELAPYPVFGETISDNRLLCQRHAGLQARMNIRSAVGVRAF